MLVRDESHLFAEGSVFGRNMLFSCQTCVSEYLIWRLLGDRVVNLREALMQLVQTTVWWLSAEKTNMTTHF